jgi:hypothetical protein
MFAVEVGGCVGIFMALLRHSDQCLYLFHQNVIYFANLCHLVHEIFTFFVKHAKNLNAHSENSVSWDLQLGFNLAFKRLRDKYIPFNAI